MIIFNQNDPPPRTRVKTSSTTPEMIKVGDRVELLAPIYVAGKIGVVCGRELLTPDELSDRWLIQVDVEKVIVSLYVTEFRVVE
ncbi:MAG: hypothetical protein SFY66_27620 [Oculatellaceae cyanobacterium bins.114]|nr:hypothetical protein [Oculatellaceae cyanobacterium bins.114]